MAEKINSTNEIAETEVLETEVDFANAGSAPEGEQMQSNRRFRGRNRQQENEDGIDSRLIQTRRVSRMYKGGRRMRMSVVVAVGDKEGKIGLASGKGPDVPSAQTKAAARAQKHMILVPLKGNTIPHEIEVKYKSTRVLLKPAAPGTGIVAGSTVKTILELAGVQDALSKVFGSTNPINVANATYEALHQMQSSRL